ncbi:MAG: dTDP-4-dehydrorhamnose reductase [Clostridiaceae bacterium]|nr:dTDP-4-dehydrorhamnose reductase [Clostridiaceae bacterium]
MRVLVTGYNGQLGYDVIKRLTARGIECKGVDIDDFDLTDAQATEAYIKTYAPTDVIHCAAYTAVDRAEETKELCYAVNVNGTENVAQACKHVHARMVYISTDYVFSGEGDAPFEVDAPKAPQSQYGLTKLLGEEKVKAYLNQYFIIRISWVFGVNGKNFIKTMLRLGAEKSELTVVNDQIGSPTYTYDLAILIADLIATDHYGTYHATNEGYCSWYEFACAIMKEAGLPMVIKPVTSDQYPAKAVRPKNSRLSKASLDQIGLARLPSWQDALKRYLVELKER